MKKWINCPLKEGQKLKLKSEQPCFSAKSDDLKQHLTLENLTRMMRELGGEWELTLKFPEQQVIKLSSERP